jgi:predicted nucleotidyltransferase
MKRESVLKKISENRKLLEAYGINDIRLFGSLARGEARAESDVDLLVEFDQSAHIGMFEFSRLQRELSELLGCEVDLSTPDAFHRDMKEDNLKEEIRDA